VIRRAIDYAHLVGKYVRLERPANEKEIERAKRVGVDQDTVGGEGFVAGVWDSPHGLESAVEVMMDYGMGVTIRASEQDAWRIFVTDGMETMRVVGR